MILLRKIFKASNVIINDEKVNIKFEQKLEPPKKSIKIQKDKEKEIQKDKNIKPTADTILESAKYESEKIIEDAKAKSEKIIEDAKKQGVKHIEEVKHKSIEEGFNEGYEKGVKEAEAIKQESEQIYQEALLEKEKILNDVEPEIVDLIIGITEKLVSKVSCIKKDLILNLIKQGLSETTLTGDINIRVSADDYEETVKNKDEILSFVANASNIEIVRDLSLTKSDCVIETVFGNIDCSLDEQFKELKDSIYFLLENR